jgi:hypothetical protein
MMIDLRPARPDDYSFALDLYLETIEPYASEWFSWVHEEQETLFSDLWRPDDTRVIVLDGVDVGWVEIRQTGDEIFLKTALRCSSLSGARDWNVPNPAAAGRLGRDRGIDGAVRA